MSKGLDVLFAEQNRKKYQEESTNVSNVSVSLLQTFPLIITFFQSSLVSKGFPFVLILIFSGSFTGKFSTGIFIMLPSSS